MCYIYVAMAYSGVMGLRAIDKLTEVSGNMFKYVFKFYYNIIHIYCMT